MMERIRSHLLEWLREWWKPACVLVVTAVLVFVMAAQNATTQAQLEAVAIETHNALCTLNDNLEQRLRDTQDYLEKHKGPEPIPGITRADLRRSVQNQKATLAALDALHCEEVEE